MIHLWAAPSVDDDTLAVLEQAEGVAGMEGFMQASLEWRLSPDDEWSPGTLTARDDYENQRFAKLDLIGGDWPRRRTFAVGQGSDVAFDIRQGSQLFIRVDVCTGSLVRTRMHIASPDDRVPFRRGF
jgi:hypothetical protein